MGFYDDLGLAQSVENLAVEQLIAKAGVETLDVAVLPGAAPLDVGGLGTDSRDPFLHRLGNELRSVVGPDVSGNAPQDEQVGQNVDSCTSSGHLDIGLRSSGRRHGGADSPLLPAGHISRAMRPA